VAFIKSLVTVVFALSSTGVTLGGFVDGAPPDKIAESDKNSFILVKLLIVFKILLCVSK
jgi:hypothetical protein